MDIEPTKHELILKQTLPLINKYADSFAIQDNASQHAKLLNAITAKNKYLIELVAQSKVPNDDKYIKYLILKHSTDENNNIAEVILHNLEKTNLQRKDVSYILNVLKNDEVPQLHAIIPYYQYLKSKNIPLQEVSQQLKNEFNIKIFNKIMEKADIYNIIDIVDIRLFLENINEKNSDFVINKLLPELLKYKQKLLLKVPDQYVDLIKSITPDTIKEIEKIARYADNYGNNLSYVNILSGITTQNAKNIDRVMENIKNTDFWGNSLVSASDFQKLLDEAK